MAWISFGTVPCREKKSWWQLASRCCWNRACPWHGSELISFLVGLRTYQHPGYFEKGLKGKLVMNLEKFSLYLEEEKGTRNAIELLRIKSQRTLDIDGELCACCIDWQTAFDRVNWTKLMQIVQRTGSEWLKRRLISRLRMKQSAKLKLDQVRQEVWRQGEKSENNAVCRRF